MKLLEKLQAIPGMALLLKTRTGQKMLSELAAAEKEIAEEAATERRNLVARLAKLHTERAAVTEPLKMKLHMAVEAVALEKKEAPLRLQRLQDAVRQAQHAKSEAVASFAGEENALRAALLASAPEQINKFVTRMMAKLEEVRQADARPKDQETAGNNSDLPAHVIISYRSLRAWQVEVLGLIPKLCGKARDLAFVDLTETEIQKLLRELEEEIPAPRLALYRRKQNGDYEVAA